MENKTKNKSGFTLLELLVVVLIISILAAIALPQYKYSVAKTKFIQIKTAAKAVKDAQTRYILAHDEISLDLSVLDIDIEGGRHTGQIGTLPDTVSFKWGLCYMTTGKESIGCKSDDLINYLFSLNSEKKYCCARATSGEIGKKLCQAEFPNATGTPNNTYCGSGGTLYEGY